MRPIIYVVMSAMILSLSVGIGHAQNYQSNEDMKKYKATDLNNDGQITREEWQGYFNNRDWNGNGVISGDEMKPGMRRWGWGRRPSSSDQFSAYDRNNDGVLSSGEWPGNSNDFTRLDLDHNGNLSVNEFYQRQGADQFGELDYNNDGYIASSEWRNTNASFQALDLNGDGRLSHDEFHNTQRYTVSVFRELDQNNDGRISQTEWRSTSVSFSNLDTNGDNLLSEDEFNSTASSQGSRIAQMIFQEVFRKR